jgi:4,5-dihydroxyphthalate decarboxylase
MPDVQRETEVRLVLELSVAVGAYDRTRAILDGSTRIEGCEVHAVALEPEEASHRAFKGQEFDVSEISLGSHMVTLARGEAPYVGVPAFVSRLFRHSGIYIRDDRGIARPQDLKGKTIGVPEYQTTANVWIRGILQDDYGVHPRDIKWRRGGVEVPGRGERASLILPPEIDLSQIPADRTLSDMLEKSEIDGIIGARAPSCFRRGADNVVRLFPAYQAVEEEYFRRTGIFPVMHIVGIRRTLAERHPWLAVSVYKAFLAAKERCMRALGEIAQLSTSQPWSVAEHERLQHLMGDDYWSYGVVENRHGLDTLARYAFEQGLTSRRLDVGEMFARSTIETAKI